MRLRRWLWRAASRLWLDRPIARQLGGSPLPPELRLLAACAWLDEADWPAQRALVRKMLNAEIEPSKFHSLAKRHRVAALVYTVLTRAVAGANIEVEWIRRLRPSACQARLRSLALDAEWRRISKLSVDAGIRIRPLKGASLSERLYGDPGIRHARDVDLLVAPQQMERLLDLLHAAGYEVDHGLWPRRRKGAAFRISRLLEYHTACRSPTGLTVEVHSHIERPPRSRMEEIWSAAAWDAEPGVQARFDFLYCTLHGCMHGWSRLKWLGDLRVMASRLGEAEWPVVIGMAGQLRLETLLAGTLLLLDRVTGLPAPTAAAALMEDERAGRLARQAIGWMTMPEQNLNRCTVRNNFRRWQLEWQVERRLPVREYAFYWLARLLFSPTDLYTFDLPAPLVLYPAIRPFSTLGRSIAAAVSRPR